MEPDQRRRVEALTLVMQKRGVGTQELSNRLMVAYSRVQQLVDGRSALRPWMLEKIAEVLNVPYAVLDGDRHGVVQWFDNNRDASTTSEPR